MFLRLKIDFKHQIFAIFNGTEVIGSIRYKKKYLTTIHPFAYTVDTRNSGPRYSGFTCFSGQNCADHL